MTRVSSIITKTLRKRKDSWQEDIVDRDRAGGTGRIIYHYPWLGKKWGGCGDSHSVLGTAAQAAAAPRDTHVGQATRVHNLAQRFFLVWPDEGRERCDWDIMECSVNVMS